MPNVFSKLLSKFASVTDEIPLFRLHVSNTAINFHDNYICSVLEFDGIVYEAISNNLLENDYDNLNLLFASTAREKAGRLSFNTYLFRRETEFSTDFKFTNKFCENFANKYLQRFNNTKYYENKFYITLLLKYDESIDEAVQEMDSLIQRFVKTLNKYEPKVLTAYKNENDVLCSEIYDFLYELINSEQPIASTPLTGTPAYEILPASTLHFGFEILQIKGQRKSRYATLFDLKDFPSPTKLGMFNSASLALPFEFNLTQSFTALSPLKAIARIETQMNQLKSMGDKAEHQHEELNEAQGYIASGETAFGEYHCVLVVYGDTKQQAIDNGTYALASFTNNAGAVFRKATGSAPATYFSQLPNYKNKPRPMLKSTRNLTAAFPMHSYSKGKAKGNPLGDGVALMPLQTLSKTLYNFNFHFTNPEQDNTGDTASATGHTLYLGASRTGKTTLQMAKIAMLERFNTAMFFLDKDRGMEIFVRAMDGDYFAIEKGKPTGINPFQFKDTPKLREFLNDLVITCATDADTTCSSEEQNQIKNAIDIVMSLPFQDRRFGSLLHSIPDRGGNELYQRLLKWCNTDENKGRFSWCLDNPVNLFEPETFKIVGFEVGQILKENYQPTEPLLSCLLYMKDEMVAKYKDILTVVEECWLPLLYPTPQKMILDVLKAGAKRGEFILLITQSPEELIKSPIFPAIVQQTSTKILLPNPNAEYSNDQGGGYSRIGLTEKEFDGVKKLALDSRTFLIKQGHNSSFAIMDLYGFSDEISVLSSTKENVNLLNDLLSELKTLSGFEAVDKIPSEIWLPIFHEARNRRKNKTLNIESLISEYV